MRNIYFWMLTLFCSSLAFAQLSEDFESDITANGWSLYQTADDDPGFVITTAQANSGSSSYYHDDNNIADVSTSYMVSPAYTVMDGNGLSVFLYQNYSVSYYNYSGILISTESGDPIANEGDFTEIFELGSGYSEDTWTQFTYDLSSYVGQTIYVAFKYTGDFAHEYYVDDFLIGDVCVSPTADFNVVENCAAGEFSIELNITNLGSSASVNYYDDQGNSSSTSSTGTVVIGPYASGTEVTVTVENADDASCSIEETLSFICPPDNDNCETAFVADAFPYNYEGDATGATQTDFVGCNSDSMNDGVWFSLTSGIAQYTINVTSNGWDAEIGIFSGSCDNLVCLDMIDSALTNGTETFTFVGEEGVDYYLVLGHYSGSSDNAEGPYVVEIIEEEIPCPAPTELSVSGLTNATAFVSWIAGEGNTSYDLEWGEEGFTPDGANVEGITTTEYTIEGLMENTAYDVYVRANCDPGTSEWVGPVTFTTLESAPNNLCITAEMLTVGETFESNPVVGYNIGASADETMPAPSCGNYDGGEVWYTVVVPETRHLIIETQADEGSNLTDTAIAVYSGSCGALTLVECNDDGGNGLYSLIDLTGLTEGETLYIAVWEWGNDSFGTFQISAHDNYTCTSPIYTHQSITDCDAETFTVVIDFEDLGSSTEVSVTSDQGDDETITDAGSYTYGPYAFGTEVNFTITTDGEECNSTFSDFVVACPPANDECEGAYTAPVNAGIICDEVVSGTIGGATDSGTDACFGTPDDDVWFSFVANEETHLISLTNVEGSTTDLYHAVYSGMCGELTNIACSDPNNSIIEGLTPGETYYVQVFSWTSTPGQDTTFDLCIKTSPDAPANDECDGALEVPVNPDLECVETTSGTIAAATDSGIESDCSGTSDDDVWFMFTAEAEVHLINLLNIEGGTIDLYHAVYEGTCDGLVNLSCSDPNTSTIEGLTIGQTYYLQVYSWTATAGQLSTFDVCVSTLPDAPENDDCSGAESLTVGTNFAEYAVTGTNIGATAMDGMPAPGCANYEGGEVWYTTTAPESGHIVFETMAAEEGSFNDSGMAVYTGNCDALTLIDCDDDSGDGLFSKIELDGQEPGTMYYIAVWEWGNNDLGNFQVSVYDDQTCEPAVYTTSTEVDCDAETFEVMFDFTELGSATSITLTDDQGSDSQTIDMPSMVTFGPYAEGTTVVISIDQGDVNCNTTESFSPTCPPANDECDSAQIVDVEEGVSEPTIWTPGTVLGATDSGVEAPTCDGFTGTPNDDVWYAFTATATDMFITLDDNFDGVVELFDGSCGNLMSMTCADLGNEPGPEIEAIGLTIGQIYYVRVFNYSASVPSDPTFTLAIWTNSMSVNDIAGLDNVKIYPNPTFDVLRISGVDVSDVQIFSMSGKMIKPAVSNDIVDTKKLPAGVYVIQITDNEGNIITRKFIKK